MSTSDGTSWKSTSGGTPKPLKDGGGLGVTRKGLEQLNEYVGPLGPLGPQDPKYLIHKPRSGLEEVRQVAPDLITICARESRYDPCFKEVDALRAKLGLEPSVPLDPKVKFDDLEKEKVEDYEYMKASLAERFRMFDGLEDTEIHLPPLVAEGNVAVPILDGEELKCELEMH